MPENPKDNFIRQEFKFFRSYAMSGVEFTLADLKRSSGRKLNDKSWETYWNKKWRQFTTEVTPGRFKVRSDFLRLDPNDFASVYRQAENLYADYDVSLRDSVLVFDFFLPLAHERELRASLDALFYSDELRSRIQEIEPPVLARILGKTLEFGATRLVDEAIRLIGENFGGYSISHVSGRFRAADRLRTRGEAAELLAEGRSYIIDETTAVVRFIFPVGAKRDVDISNLGSVDLDLGSEMEGMSDLSDMIRGLLVNVFVRSLVRTVRYEDEIWLLETGNRSRLWQLRANKKDDLGNIDDLYSE